MTKRTSLLVGAATALALLAATPASALVAWTCTAKDSAGKSYTKEIYGLFSLDTKPSAQFWTTMKCKAESSKPATCTISSCRKTQD